MFRYVALEFSLNAQNGQFFKNVLGYANIPFCRSSEILGMLHLNVLSMKLLHIKKCLMNKCSIE